MFEFVLVVPYWNVNKATTKTYVVKSGGFSSTILECKYQMKIVSMNIVQSFSSTILECKLFKLHNLDKDP